jgi:hypothetical protein
MINVSKSLKVVAEKFPPGTAARQCANDKYNLPMFSDVCQAETKAQ